MVSRALHFEIPVDDPERAGGTPLTENVPIPAVGRSAHVREAEGNVIGLFQSDPDVTGAAG